MEYGLGLVLFARGGPDAERALEHLRRAAELRAGEADFHYRYGLVQLEAERFAEALPALARAVELAKGNAAYRVPLAVARARTGDRAGAIAELKAMLDLSPSPDDVRRGRKVAETINDPYRDLPRVVREEVEAALAYMARADAPRQALEALERVLERFPDLGAVHALTGLCWARLDEASRAIAAYQRAAELSPLDPLPRLYLGNLYFARERPEQAREHYLAALERDPFATDAWRRLGEAALQRTDGKEAARAFERLVLLQPDEADVRVLYGRALLEAGDEARAETALNEALDRNPRSTDALSRLGLLYAARRLKAKDASEKRRLGEMAAGFFAKVLEIDPENQAAAQALASVRE
jgi:tetratricopeptide (TPR) repeat protein